MSATLLGVLPGNPTPVKAQAAKLSYHAATERLAYAQGRTVVLRSLAPIGGSAGGASASGGLKYAQPGTALYAQHAHPVTVARFSPSGFYCASADASGLVRVWDLLNLETGNGETPVLKLEIRALGGPIKDLAWDAEGKRILAVGEGRDAFGSVFMLDGGSSAGTIEGHSKPINAVAANSARPFRALTAADDNQLAWYTGVPFKMAKTIGDAHTRFVQACAFSPRGAYALSAGSDGRIVLLDGKSGDILAADVSGGAHRGTVYAVEFSPDSDEVFVSAGADATLKVWDLPSGSTAAKLRASVDLKIAGAERGDDQLVAACFAGAQRVVAQSGNGQLTVVDISASSPKAQALHAPSKSITALHAEQARLYGASYDGKVVAWDLSAIKGDELLRGGAAPCEPLAGAVSGSAAPAVTGLAGAGGRLVSVGLDDALKSVDAGGAGTALSGQPKGISLSAESGLAYVATPHGLDVVDPSAGKKVHTAAAGSSTPSAVAAQPSGSLVALGSEDGSIRLYASGAGGALKELPKAGLTGNRSAVTALAFSPSGRHLAAGESSGKIIVYDLSNVSEAGDEASIATSRWVFHTARIHSIAWSPDGDAAVSGSLDTNVYVWSLSKPMKNISIKNAHAGGVNAVAWLDDARIATAGSDACARLYAIKRHA